jgi:hypothetical protein
MQFIGRSSFRLAGVHIQPRASKTLYHPRTIRVQARNLRSTGWTINRSLDHPTTVSSRSVSFRGISNHAVRDNITSEKKSNDELARAERDELEDWETVIGLEIHAQIKTGRKLFSCTSYGLYRIGMNSCHRIWIDANLPHVLLSIIIVVMWDRITQRARRRSRKNRIRTSSLTMPLSRGLYLYVDSLALHIHGFTTPNPI